MFRFKRLLLKVLIHFIDENRLLLCFSFFELHTFYYDPGYEYLKDDTLLLVWMKNNSGVQTTLFTLIFPGFSVFQGASMPTLFASKR